VTITGSAGINGMKMSTSIVFALNFRSLQPSELSHDITVR
jgi:hypothetical protein